MLRQGEQALLVAAVGQRTPDDKTGNALAVRDAPERPEIEKGISDTGSQCDSDVALQLPVASRGQFGERQVWARQQGEVR